MSEEKPAILIAGGRPSDPAIMTRIMAQAFSGVQEALTAYIGTANGDNSEFFKRMESGLREAGAGKVVPLRLANEKPDLRQARDILARADVIFLAGGEVEDGMVWLEKHDLSKDLKAAYREGKRFIGVSAGSIMMGSHWVRWEVPEDDSSASLFDCLGIIPLLFDVHGEEEDWTELKAALTLMGDGAQGFGLPRESAVSADSQGTLVNLHREYLLFVNEGGRIRVNNS
ncbi:MAG: Type 1 glutamine amidotransferase-like domain-containing protein [Clostridiales bacterium]|nr:Type 1 glutamine amidotransferase-like domain-containing protein [Clostridiales bacterium]